MNKKKTKMKINPTYVIILVFVLALVAISSSVLAQSLAQGYGSTSDMSCSCLAGCGDFFGCSAVITYMPPPSPTFYYPSTIIASAVDTLNHRSVDGATVSCSYVTGPCRSYLDPKLGVVQECQTSSGSCITSGGGVCAISLNNVHVWGWDYACTGSAPYYNSQSGNVKIYGGQTATVIYAPTPACTLNSVSLTPQCSGGATADCEEGEKIKVDAAVSGCSAADNLQADVGSSDGLYTIKTDMAVTKETAFFSESFEYSDSLSNHWNTNGLPTPFITTSAYWDGFRSAGMYDSLYDNSPSMSVGGVMPPTGSFNITFYSKITAADYMASGALSFYVTDGLKLVFSFFDRKLILEDGSGSSVVGSFSTGSWVWDMDVDDYVYKPADWVIVRFEIDKSTGKYDFYYGGVKMASQRLLKPSQYQAVRIEFVNDAYSVAWNIDKIRITKVDVLTSVGGVSTPVSTKTPTLLSGEWTVPSVPTSYIGKTITPTKGGTYAGGPPSIGINLANTTTVSGSFKFACTPIQSVVQSVLPASPVTLSANQQFTVTATVTDNCVTPNTVGPVYYKIVDTSADCTLQTQTYTTQLTHTAGGIWTTTATAPSAAGTYKVCVKAT